MPHLFSFVGHSNDDTVQDVSPKCLRRQSLLRKPLSFLRRQHTGSAPRAISSATAPTEPVHLPDYFIPRRPSLPDNAASCKRVIPSLPRPQTFRRQESEKRERLLETLQTSCERRALSADRRTASRHDPSISTDQLHPLSAPVITESHDAHTAPIETHAITSEDHSQKRPRADLSPPLPRPDDQDQTPVFRHRSDHYHEQTETFSVHDEFQRQWILNLSMHFRDKSNREKFFITYAEKPNQWRRLTVSLDYRNAPDDSLEKDLSTLYFQREKSLRIFEAIRDSLSDIQYYDTVTNLKLETSANDGQLHVHVREDANEIIQFPAISLFDHIRCPRFSETTLDFESHLSGFVYKVRLTGRILIKKEIPGPDTVDEFLYEVNALDSLLGARNVVQLEGLVTDGRGELVKGLLLAYASQGSLVDVMYDFRGTSQLPWHRREKWAKQVVTGLSAVHEAGFVQGDFTLSNIVIDDHDDAQIIDINRRGCPVGWEPPELSRLIESGQRISMCIGVKTDLFQLGVVLWALAEEVDEPERVERPLPDVLDDIPDYFRDIVRTCLSERPQGRIGAKALLSCFPCTAGLSPRHTEDTEMPRCEPRKGATMAAPTATTAPLNTSHRSAKEYIDPSLAVTIDEVKDCRRLDSGCVEFNDDHVTYVNPDSNPASSTYRFQSRGRSRGRSPVSSRRRRSSPYGKTASSATSLSGCSPARRSRTEDRSHSDAGTPRSLCYGNPTDDVDGRAENNDESSRGLTDDVHHCN